jgi:hypothetical protein
MYYSFTSPQYTAASHLLAQFSPNGDSTYGSVIPSQHEYSSRMRRDVKGFDHSEVNQHNISANVLFGIRRQYFCASVKYQSLICYVFSLVYSIDPDFRTKPLAESLYRVVTAANCPLHFEITYYPGEKLYVFVYGLDTVYARYCVTSDDVIAEVGEECLTTVEPS